MVNQLFHFLSAELQASSLKRVPDCNFFLILFSRFSLITFFFAFFAYPQRSLRLFLFNHRERKADAEFRRVFICYIPYSFFLRVLCAFSAFFAVISFFTAESAKQTQRTAEFFLLATSRKLQVSSKSRL
jgi:hypothetical protein